MGINVEDLIPSALTKLTQGQGKDQVGARRGYKATEGLVKALAEKFDYQNTSRRQRRGRSFT